LYLDIKNQVYTESYTLVFTVLVILLLTAVKTYLEDFSDYHLL